MLKSCSTSDEEEAEEVVGGCCYWKIESLKGEDYSSGRESEAGHCEVVVAVKGGKGHSNKREKKAVLDKRRSVVGGAAVESWEWIEKRVKVDSDALMKGVDGVNVRTTRTFEKSKNIQRMNRARSEVERREKKMQLIEEREREREKKRIN